MVFIERAIATLSIIGPAVFNGGLSTFLAFVLLGSSEAYLFNTFFKVLFKNFAYFHPHNFVNKFYKNFIILVIHVRSDIWSVSWTIIFTSNLKHSGS